MPIGGTNHGVFFWGLPCRIAGNLPTGLSTEVLLRWVIRQLPKRTPAGVEKLRVIEVNTYITSTRIAFQLLFFLSGVNGTPTFFINESRLLAYDETYESLLDAVLLESELKQH